MNEYSKEIHKGKEIKQEQKDKVENKQVIDAYILPQDIFEKVLIIVGKVPAEISDGIYSLLKNQKPTKITLSKDDNNLENKQKWI